MQISLITPIAHLDYSYLLPGRFCIASIAAKHMDYRKFFRDASYAGYTIIMDTGTFEDNLISQERYLELILEIQPDIVVAPDIIGGDTFEGFETAVAFAKRVEACWLAKAEQVSKSTPAIMFVPQCIRGQTYVFEQVLDAFLDEGSLQWLGVCRDAVYNAYGHFTQTKRQELNRFYFASRLQALPVFEALREAKKKFHFLGVGERIDMLQHYWFVDSMDTTAPFWQGYLGANAIAGILPTIMKRPYDYFTRPYPGLEETESLIKHNCLILACYANKALDLRKDKEGTRL